jgi:GntR family transcriptional regulator/MocR family aminotransferase
MLGPLADDGSTPLYQRLRAALEHAIATGSFPDGRLPSSRELAATTGVSRNTATLAYVELQADGFVESRPRSGLFVNEEMREILAQGLLGTARQATDARPDWNIWLSAETKDPNAGQLAVTNQWSNYEYPFLSAQIGTDEFPRTAWTRATREALHANHRPFSLGDSRGNDPLLAEQILTRVLPARGVFANPDELLITNGSQHGLYLVAQSLGRPGLQVVVEEPGWADARIAFATRGAVIKPVSLDTGGLILTQAVEEAQIVYVTPSHNFPSGVTMSAGRRHRLLALAREIDAIIIEDDYDSELRHVGRPSPALKGLDSGGRVVYLGSFSKFLAPGLRLGFIVAAPEAIAHMREWQRLMVRQAPAMLQRTLGLFLASGDYERWMRQHRKALRTKWKAIVSAAERHLPWSFEPQTGGTGLWIEAPPGYDVHTLMAAAENRGVLLESGEPSFACPPDPVNFMRLGYLAIELRRIEPGLEILGELARRDL